MKELEKLQKQYLYLLSKGKNQEMIPIIEKALQICDKYNLDKKKIEILNDYSGALRNTGRKKEAILAIKQSIKILDNINICKGSEAYINIIINLANTYREYKKYKEAYMYFCMAKFYVLNENNYSTASLYNNLSLLFLDTGRFFDAINLENKAIKILKSIGNKVQLAESYASLSNMYYEIGYEIDSYKAMEKSKNIALKHLDKDSRLYENIIDKYNDFFNIKGEKKKGIEESEEFFYSEVLPLFKKKYTDILPYSAFGLVGMGSECLGYDDYLSRDHDFDKRVILFLPKDVYDKCINNIHFSQENLSGLIQVQTIESFYKYYTLYENGPVTNREFLKVPQDLLKTATNGKVYVDNFRKFTEIRKRLLKYYPNDVRLKKMAFCLNKMAQSGQYNYLRSVKRKDYIASLWAKNEFIRYLIEFLHLINKKYMPYYKWYKRSLLELDLYDITTFENLEKLALANDEDKSKDNYMIIESICKKVVTYLNYTKLTDSSIDFLIYQALEIVKNIQDESLRKEDTWVI